MNRSAWVISGIQGLLLASFTVGVARRWFPLGVPGEWEWLRLPAVARLDLVNLGLGAAALLAFAGFGALGVQRLRRLRSIQGEVGWLAGLAAMAVLGQLFMQEAAPQGYGLAKWILALRNEGSSGYQTVARTEMPTGIAPFLKDYPSWVAGQDSLHIGTHPPGLFVLARLTQDLCRSSPELARWLVDSAPGSAAAMIRVTRASDPLSRADAAALVLTGAITLVGSALTVVPLYLLVRSACPAEVAWAAATLWPLLPATLLFQPTADTAFPLLATAALAATAWAVRSSSGSQAALLALGSGMLLAVGMQFTLAFLAVGLVVAILLIGTSKLGEIGFRLGLVGVTGVGFAAATLAWWGWSAANPVQVWWINQQHHAQFYRDYPRSFWLWTGANGVETVVGVGIASVVLAGCGAIKPRSVPLAGWATLITLVLLSLSGRSLSEVARLWLPLFPPLLSFAAAGWQRLGARPLSLAITIIWLGLQTLILQGLIQVVYPI